jgi:ribosomal protein S27E
MTHFRAIMDRNISELEVSVTCPLAPDPLNTTQEANIMLPENERPDYRISTTANNENQDEFECDRCGNTFYQLVVFETQTYAKCLECGWMCADAAAIASVGGAA